MEQLYQIKAILMNSIQGQLSNLDQADTHELGEVIDMIKDISEAIYYCSMVENNTRKKGFLNGNGYANDMEMYNYARGNGGNGGNRNGNYSMYTMNNQYREPYMDNGRMMPQQGGQM